MATKDLGKRLAKKQKRAEAKAKRKVTKAEARAKIAKTEGYGTVANKRTRTAGDISKARTRTVNKGPKTVSTSTSYKEGDKTMNVTNKSKTTVTSSGAASGSKSGSRSGSSSNSGSSSRSNQGQKQGQKQQMNSQNRGNMQNKRPYGGPPQFPKKYQEEMVKPYMEKRIKMKTGGMVNSNMRSMSVDAKSAYKSNKKRRSMPRGY